MCPVGEEEVAHDEDAREDPQGEARSERDQGTPSREASKHHTFTPLPSRAWWLDAMHATARHLTASCAMDEVLLLIWSWSRVRGVASRLGSAQSEP